MCSLSYPNPFCGLASDGTEIAQEDQEPQQEGIGSMDLSLGRRLLGREKVSDDYIVLLEWHRIINNERRVFITTTNQSHKLTDHLNNIFRSLSLDTRKCLGVRLMVFGMAGTDEIKGSALRGCRQDKTTSS